MNKILLGALLIMGILLVGFGFLYATTTTPVPHSIKSDSTVVEYSKSTATAEVFLEQRCKELSEQSVFEYQIIVAEVIAIERFPPTTLDCFESSGCLQGQETIVANLLTSSAGDIRESKEIAIYTKLEAQTDLRNEDQYMKQGGRYTFCAREVDRFEFINKGKQPEKPKYKIDFVETILPLD
jgi:hypothetical protein